MGRVFKLIFRIIATLVVVVVLGGIGLMGWMAWRFQASLPQVEGEAAVAGLGEEALVYRDAYGVPHIFAQTDEDVAFALGYVHAQDRLFQMDLIRRAVQGRLSEVVGEAALGVDRRARNLGFARAAREAAASFDPEIRALAQAYADGVNARINQRGFVAPPEYQLLMFSPEPWSVEDTAGVLYYMADQLVVGAGDEIDRRELAEFLSAEQVDEFMPGYPDFAPIALSSQDMGLLPPPQDPPVAPAFVPPSPPSADPALRPGVEEAPSPGSNNWVVSGEHTVSGAPLLANDPHLGIGAPSVWYFARLAMEDGDVVGATLPGTPLVVLGRNESAAWAFTNAGFDVSDIETAPADTLETTAREETIEVRGLLGASTRTFTYLDTADGPVFDRDWYAFDMYPEDLALVFHSSLDDPDNAGASSILGLMRARSWDDFVSAGEGWTAPIQSMLFANAEGVIGYAAPGRAPIRDEEGRWVGEIPFDDMPRARDPASGRIITANNRITPEDYPYPMPGDYAVYRAMRIGQRLDDTNLHDLDSFRDVQNDVTSEHVRRLMPALSRSRPQTDLGRAALALLDDWNGEMDAELAQPLVFAMWYRMLHPAIYADELGEGFERFDYSRRVFIDHVLNGRYSHWCDNVDTENDRETCAQTTGLALDAAAARLVELYGPSPDAWRWGDVHQAVFDHPVPFLNTLPVLGRLFEVRAPMGGDGSTVNVAHFSFRADNFDVGHAASLRAIYDLSDLDRSLFMHAPGQSGHPLSPHYRDLAPLWSAGEYFEIRTDWDPSAPPPEMRLLRLTPAG